MKEDFKKQLSVILEKYEKNVADLLNGTAEELAVEAAQKLKAASPRSKARHKHYADSWMVTQQKVGQNSFKYIVHNKKGQLTQLLEKPHPLRNGQMTSEGHGRHEHIEPVNDWVVKEYKKRVEDALEGKGTNWSWMTR